MTLDTLEQFIKDLKPVFQKYGIDHATFDKHFRKSEVYKIITSIVNIEERKYTCNDPFGKGLPQFENYKEKKKNMELMRKHGMTLQHIGSIYGISGERVRQIIS